MIPDRRPRPSRSSPRRRGVGAPFIVVMSVMVLLSLFAMSMSIRSQGATLQSNRAASLERCEALAEMAIREALHRIRRRVNEPGDEFFEAFRADDLPRSLRLDPGDLLSFSGDLQRFPAYGAGPVEVEVLRKAPLSSIPEESLPYDAGGLVRLSCRVEGPRNASARQVLEFGFKSLLAGVSRPFDMMTFLMLEPASLLSHKAMNGDANETMRRCAGEMARHRQGLRDFATKLTEAADRIEPKIADAKQKIRDAESSPVGQVVSLFGGMDLDEAKQKVRQAEASLVIIRQLAQEYSTAAEPPAWPADPDWELHPAGVGTTGDPYRLHEFGDPLVIYTLAPEIDLEAVNLPLRNGTLIADVLRQAEEHQDAWQKVQDELERIRDQQDIDFTGLVQPARDALAISVDQVADLDGVLDHYKQFQDLLVEISGDEATELRKRFRRLSRRDLARRAHYHFTGPGATARARAFLTAPGQPAPSGVMWVDDPDTSATLTIQLPPVQGRLVVASQNSMVVEAAMVQDPARDSLVLVTMGEMELAVGGVQAALVAHSDRYRGPEADFSGALLLEGLDALRIETALRGKLRKLPGTLTGPPGNQDRPLPARESQWVALGPAPLYRRVER